MVLSSHQTEDVSASAQRIAVIHEGRSLFTGTPGRADRAGGRSGLVDRTRGRRRAAGLAHRRRRLIRNVGDPPAGAELTPPTLEDAYLLLVGDTHLAVAS